MLAQVKTLFGSKQQTTFLEDLRNKQKEFTRDRIHSIDKTIPIDFGSSQHLYRDYVKRTARGTLSPQEAAVQYSKPQSATITIGQLNENLVPRGSRQRTRISSGRNRSKQPTQHSAQKQAPEAVSRNKYHPLRQMLNQQFYSLGETKSATQTAGINDGSTSIRKMSTAISAPFSMNNSMSKASLATPTNLGHKKLKRQSTVSSIIVAPCGLKRQGIHQQTQIAGAQPGDAKRLAQVDRSLSDIESIHSGSPSPNFASSDGQKKRAPQLNIQTGLNLLSVDAGSRAGATPTDPRSFSPLESPAKLDGYCPQTPLAQAKVDRSVDRLQLGGLQKSNPNSNPHSKMNDSSSKQSAFSAYSFHIAQESAKSESRAAIINDSQFKAATTPRENEKSTFKAAKQIVVDEVSSSVSSQTLTSQTSEKPGLAALPNSSKIGKGSNFSSAMQSRVSGVEDRPMFHKKPRLFERRLSTFHALPGLPKHNVLDEHRKKYNQNKLKIDLARSDVEEILTCEVYLHSHSIECYKYNYALEDIVQNFPCFQGYINLSKDSEFLSIITKKPTEARVKQDVDGEDESLEEQEYKFEKSSTSCRVRDIQGILVGGINSRFWMLRKYFNSLKQHEIKDLPFYAWQCITIQLPHRDVDLVVPDDYQMDHLLKFLIHKLRTFDGQRGSSEQLLTAMNEQCFADYKREKGKKLISQSVQHSIIQANEQKLFRKVYFRFLLLRIRCKISFMALQKRMTILELFATTIHNVYRQYERLGILEHKQSDSITKKEEIVYKKLVSGNLKGFFREMIELHTTYKQNKSVLRRLSKIKLIEDEEQFVEDVTYKKNGKVRVKRIDQQETNEVINQIQQVTNKNKCFDIFNNIRLGDQAKSSQKKFIKTKFERNFKEIIIRKIKLIIGLKVMSGITFVRAIMKKIDLQKELFIMDIEEGLEVFIPPELSQDQYPFSFRYYDPILSLVQENITDEIKEQFNIKSLVAFMIHRDNDFKQKAMEQLGLVENGKEKKLTYNHTAVNKIVNSLIDHKHIPQSMAMQRSKYICIDNDLSKKNLLGHNAQQFLRSARDTKGMTNSDFDALRQAAAKVGDPDAKKKAMPKNHLDLNVRYCPMNEVNKKRQIFLRVQAQFFSKIKHLKGQGQKLEVIHLLNQWIDENLDDLYKDEGLRRLFLNAGEKQQGGKVVKDPNSLMARKEEYYLKNKFKQLMVAYFEEKIIARRQKRRLNQVEDLLYNLRPSKDYREKQQFVENSIEADILYFNERASTTHRAKNDLDIVEINKLLRKVNNRLENSTNHQLGSRK